MFDAHVNVFVYLSKGMLAATDIQPNSFQPSNDPGTLGIRENFRLQESFAMSNASLNIMSVQTLIER